MTELEQIQALFNEVFDFPNHPDIPRHHQFDRKHIGTLLAEIVGLRAELDLCKKENGRLERELKKTRPYRRDRIVEFLPADYIPKEGE